MSLPQKPVDPVKVARKLMQKHLLSSITVSITSANVVVEAYPDNFNPIVEQRRTAAFAKKDGSISLAEAEEINRRSLGPLVRAITRDLNEGLAALAAGLGGDPS